MTSYGDTAVPSALRSDGLSIESLSEAISQRGVQTAVDSSHSFWVSGSRPISSTASEIMEVSFGSPRLLNSLSMKISHFPLTMKVQWLDENSEWQPLYYTVKPGGPQIAVSATITNSIPAVLNSASHVGGKHYAPAHWDQVSWKVLPVTTAKIRLVFQRYPQGIAPTNQQKVRQSYSVAVRSLLIGYKVTTREDLPIVSPTLPDQGSSPAVGDPSPWFASSKDILGSQVVWGVYEQPADSMVDGDRDTYWRSEPQPFSFAVVNTYLDVRDDEGEAAVVDRFYVDPITVGVACNVYWSNDQPDGRYLSPSTAIPPGQRVEKSLPDLNYDGLSDQVSSFSYAPANLASIQVSNVITQMHYNEPWWVGLDADVLAPPDDHHYPIISVGNVEIRQAESTIEVIDQSGVSASIPLDPELHRLNARFRLVVAYHPRDEITSRPAYLRIVYYQAGYAPLAAEQEVTDLMDQSAPLWVGHSPDPNGADIAAMSVRGLIVKAETLTDETESLFMSLGQAYVADPSNPLESKGYAVNARLRIHPMFYSTTNRFAVVGGVGDNFGDMVWTPVIRDYALKQGYIHLPPTRAKFWKFEMTNLTPQIYETSQLIDREVLVFPPNVVQSYAAVSRENTSNSVPAGVTSNGALADEVSYSDALLSLQSLEAPPEATQVLVLKDPTQAAQIAKTGWVWNYQPWHIGTGAPQFPGKTKHRYESLHVQHSSKVAYFAAIKELMPYRVDYSYDDDTPEYVDHFLDQSNLDVLDSVVFDENGITSIGSAAQVISKTMPTYRNIRGIQFATQETNSVQVLTDPQFKFPSLRPRWLSYGDAEIERLSDSDVLVNRGYLSNTYGEIENEYASYGAMENKTWGELEGDVPILSSSTEGGIISAPYTPSGGGSLKAKVEVSSDSDLNAPIFLEIISVQTGQVVGSAESQVYAGSVVSIEVSYTPGTLLKAQNHTWGQIEDLNNVLGAEDDDPLTPDTGQPEALYGDLDGLSFRTLEGTSKVISSDVYVRVRQRGAGSDQFHVHKIDLFDSPIAWFFSNDDGATWWQAIDVNSDPFSVLLLPASSDPDPEDNPGKSLKWRADIFHPGASISSLYIRPWYGSHSRTAEPFHALDALGPNKSTYDTYPPTYLHPMWLSRNNDAETDYVYVPPTVFWRNIVLNPSAEIDFYQGETWLGAGGTVDLGFIWPQGAKFGNGVALWTSLGSGAFQEDPPGSSLYQTNFEEDPEGSALYLIPEGVKPDEVDLGLYIPGYSSTMTINGPPDSVNQGYFSIGVEQETIGAGVWIDSAEDVWVQQRVTWGVFFNGKFQPLTRPINVGPSTQVSQWTLFEVNLPINQAATHWKWDFLLTEDDPAQGLATAPNLGKQVAFDAAYVTDNGKDPYFNDQPYLDGEQPYGIWEGDPHHSASIYGTKTSVAGDIVLAESFVLDIPEEEHQQQQQQTDEGSQP